MDDQTWQQQMIKSPLSLVEPAKPLVKGLSLDLMEPNG